MAEHQVLFCPFCRESFEGLKTCPEHDLRLVPFSKLAPDPAEIKRLSYVDEDKILAPFELRFGRAYVALGALANLLALPLPLIRLPGGKSYSTLFVAAARPALWTLALVTFTLLFVLQRRRSPRALRGMRVLVPLLACVSPATVLWELQRVRGGAAAWLTRGEPFELGPALYVVVVGAVLTALGGARLGVQRP
jgi:hypothetical protein